MKNLRFVLIRWKLSFRKNLHRHTSVYQRLKNFRDTNNTKTFKIFWRKKNENLIVERFRSFFERLFSFFCEKINSSVDVIVGRWTLLQHSNLNCVSLMTKTIVDRKRKRKKGEKKLQQAFLFVARVFQCCASIVNRQKEKYILSRSRERKRKERQKKSNKLCAKRHCWRKLFSFCRLHSFSLTHTHTRARFFFVSFFI